MRSLRNNPTCFLAAVGLCWAGALVVLATPALGQHRFACSPGGFLVQDDVAKLFVVDESLGTFSEVGLAADMELNAMGFRKTDGFLYAVQLSPGGNERIVQIDRKGDVYKLGRPAGLPPEPRFDSGDVSPDGTTMYISAPYERLYKVSLTSVPKLPEVTSVAIVGDTGIVNDWAAHPTDGLLYGGDQTHGELAVLNPVTGERTDYAVEGLPGMLLPRGVGYGGAWFDAQGQLYLYRNSGATYVLDPKVPRILSVHRGRPCAHNDAASCVPCAAPVTACDRSTVLISGGTLFCDAPDGDESEQAVRIREAGPDIQSLTEIRFYQAAESSAGSTVFREVELLDGEGSQVGKMSQAYSFDSDTLAARYELRGTQAAEMLARFTRLPTAGCPEEQRLQSYEFSGKMFDQTYEIHGDATGAATVLDGLDLGALTEDLALALGELAAINEDVESSGLFVITVSEDVLNCWNFQARAAALCSSGLSSQGCPWALGEMYLACGYTIEVPPGLSDDYAIPGVSVCGNGVRERGEECDGADAPTCPGRCIDDTCRCEFAPPDDSDPGRLVGGVCGEVGWFNNYTKLDEEAHPDGDYSVDEFCWNSQDDDEERVCVRTQTTGGVFGVCRRCEGDGPYEEKLPGCTCETDFECGSGNYCWGNTTRGSSTGLCYPQDGLPDWQCDVNCAELYGGYDGFGRPYGYCVHEQPLGHYDGFARCAARLCDPIEVMSECPDLGKVCLADANCGYECSSDQDCWDLGYPGSYTCVDGWLCLSRQSPL